MVPIDAAKRLLASHGASVRFEVERWKDTDASEILITAEGLIDPAEGRGDLTYDFTTLFSDPAVPVTSPNPESLYQVRWDTTDTYFYSLSTADEGWGHMSRADARERGGLLGRLYIEVIGVVALVAHSDPSTVTATTPADLGGESAERFIGTIGVADAIAEGVPADVPDEGAFRAAYGVDTLPIEMWLVGGELKRIRYSVAREKALYGGPDRTQITYDWEPAPPVDIEIPPPGTIVER
jgi:hypothetical protein